MVPSAVAACSYYVVEKICERKVGIPRSTTGKHNGEYGVKCSVSFAGVELLRDRPPGITLRHTS